ncbi:MAG: hypothetical protein DU480_06100 [Nitrosomonas sp.]
MLLSFLMKTTGFNIGMQKNYSALENFLAFYYFRLLIARLSVCLFVLSNQHVVKLQQIALTNQVEIKLIT